MRQNINTTVLPNGITILTDEMPSAHSVALGVWIPRGSRHESSGENGISHFYEHLVFKGTKNRNAFQIASAIEDRGGILEAYTTRQETGFYAQIIPSDAALALDVVADLIMNPLFTEEDTEKERKVIIEEIRSYDDIAEENVADLFYKTHYAGCGLENPIAGLEKQVKNLSHESLLRIRHQTIKEIPLYICAAGKIKHDWLVEQCKKLFSKKKILKKNPLSIAYSENAGFCSITKPDLQQSSFVWGTSFPVSHKNNKLRYALSVFNLAFGSGMSSRLFQKVREEFGLAYSVYSTVDVFNDCFGFSISLATDPEHLQQAAELSRDELRRFLDKGFVAQELERTRQNIIGSVNIGADNTEKRLLRLAEHTLHYGKCENLNDVQKNVLNLNGQEILDLLQTYFHRALWSIAVIQPKKAPRLRFDGKL